MSPRPGRSVALALVFVVLGVVACGGGSENAPPANAPEAASGSGETSAASGGGSGGGSGSGSGGTVSGSGAPSQEGDPCSDDAAIGKPCATGLKCVMSGAAGTCKRK